MTITRSDVANLKPAEVQQLVDDLVAQKEDLRATVLSLEQELKQARRLEVIGRLSGGVAHDFNNLLMGVGGCIDVSLTKLDAEHAARKYLQEAKRAIATGATITRQLLRFTRAREVPSAVQGLDKILQSTAEMLRRLVGPAFEVNVIASAKEEKIWCPEGAIEEILMNLLVNARDAMPEGGMITIETGVVGFEEPQASRHVGGKPGQYLMLRVGDDGSGMDRETLLHVFEPAFATKAFGRRAGLGLVTVHDLVKQSGGYVEVTSKRGVGTTFTMYFPRASVGPALPASPAVVDAPEAPSSAALVALVVDDEPMIRLYIRCMMERLGYSVLEASDGAAALQLCRERSRIDVLLTDVFLPGIQGVLLARELRAVQPRSAFLFMSAYPAETLLREGRLLPGMLSLQKPFSESALQAALEVALGAGGTPPIRSRESL